MSPQADWTVTTPALTPAAAAMQVYNTGSSLDVRDSEAEGSGDVDTRGEGEEEALMEEEGEDFAERDAKDADPDGVAALVSEEDAVGAPGEADTHELPDPPPTALAVP